MAKLQRNILSRAGGLLKRSPIKKRGSRTIAWEKLRKEKAERDVDDEGLIRCQDHLLGLPRCGIARSPEQMDLHHSEGRDGKLLLDESKLFWLIRTCHNTAHGGNVSL